MQSVAISPFNGHTFDFEGEVQLANLTFDGLPVIHWVREKMQVIALEHDEAKTIKFLCTFCPEPRWAYRGRPIMVGGLVVQFTCTKDWVSQEVRPNVSLGYYDHLRKSIVVPDKQWYALGEFDNKAWKKTDKQWEYGEMAPNSFRVYITLWVWSNLLPNASEVFPPIDELIAEQRIDTEQYLIPDSPQRPPMTHS